MPDISFVEANGSRFHCRLDGPAGAPVLMLSNSLGTEMGMWEPQVAALAERFRVLRYDARGHGQSVVTPGPYTIEGLARDAMAILDSMKIERAHFCGLSMGGMIGIWLGINAPHRLKKLVLCNTGARIGTPDIWAARIAKARAGGMAAIADAVIPRWFTDTFIADAPGKVEFMRQMLLRCPGEGYAASCEAIRDMDQNDQLTRIEVPTLVIAGSRDPVTPPADCRLLSERIHGAKYAELNASHLSNIEASHPFTDALVTFLAETEA
jgi:3-oxoadipate enol-lactonase